MGGETEIDDDASDKELVVKMNMKADDKKDITGRVGAYIDMTRYYVFTSAKENHVSVLWKDREKSKNWSKYKHAVNKLRAIIPKPRAMRAIFAMKLPREGGWKECAERAREWQQWHSDIVDIGHCWRETCHLFAISPFLDHASPNQTYISTSKSAWVYGAGVDNTMCSAQGVPSR